MDLVLTRARLDPELCPVGVDAGVYDITVASGRITSIEPTAGQGGDIDLDGRLVLPGLWDHHVHFGVWALLAHCFPLSQDASLTEATLAVAARHGAQPDGPLIGFGFRSATWSQPPTAAMLDAISATRPIALISADLHSVWLNTAAMTHYHLTPGTGFLVEQDAFAVQLRLLGATPHDDRPAIAHAAHLAASRGVVGIVDMQMSWNIDPWLNHFTSGFDALRVHAATYPADLDRLLRLGLRTGQRLSELLTVGPLKVVTDGSMGTRTALCCAPYANPLPGLPHGEQNVDEVELVDLLRRAHAHGVGAAVHAIGDRATHQALNAFELSGARGAIEHAQLIAATDVRRFAALGITASVQPSHLLDDHSLIDHVWPGRGERCFPLRDLLDAGTTLAFGSDAPVTTLDPWVSISAAVHRAGWHLEQSVTLREAITASVRAPLREGGPADLIALDADPRTLTASELASCPVSLTLLNGRITHG